LFAVCCLLLVVVVFASLSLFVGVFHWSCGCLGFFVCVSLIPKKIIFYSNIGIEYNFNWFAEEIGNY
jgi:hypothetical protein